jgi:hypothetical protein
MARERDFMDDAADEYRVGLEDQTPIEPQPPVAYTPLGDVTPTPIPEPTPPVGDIKPTPTFTQEDVLREWNKLTGSNFDTIDKAKDFADKYSKYGDLEQQAGLIPDLVDALEKAENPMKYFRDEIHYKVSMLSKEPKYTGKEDIVNEILRGDLESLNDVKVIALAAALKASKGVRSPLRAELRSMNIDPDDILGDDVKFDDLDNDTKDLLKIKADSFREELSKLGENIKTPSFEGTVVERLLNQKKAAKEDFEANMTKVMPVAEGIIGEIKEIKLTDDFSFKLDLTRQQQDYYKQELAQMLVSGRYDLNTEAGKATLYGELMTMIKADNFDKAVSSLSSFKATKIEEEMRRKYNNEVPLGKNEPPPGDDKGDDDPMNRAANQLISERQ